MHVCMNERMHACIFECMYVYFYGDLVAGCYLFLTHVIDVLNQCFTDIVAVCPPHTRICALDLGTGQSSTNTYNCALVLAFCVYSLFLALCF